MRRKQVETIVQGRKPAKNRRSVTTTDGPALTIKFTQQEKAALDRIQECHRKKAEEAGTISGASYASIIRMLVKRHAEDLGVWE
jgi:hypothetical protein